MKAMSLIKLNCCVQQNTRTTGILKTLKQVVSPIALSGFSGFADQFVRTPLGPSSGLSLCLWWKFLSFQLLLFK